MYQAFQIAQKANKDNRDNMKTTEQLKYRNLKTQEQSKRKQ